MSDKKFEILIVDDNVDFLEAAKIILSENNLEVTTVETGFESLKLIKKKTFDIILLDVNLPDSVGYDLAAEIRKSALNRYSRIILSSNESKKPENIIKGLESGADDYIARPISNKELSARIKAHTRIIQLENEKFKIQEDYSFIFNNVRDIIFVLNLNGEIKSVNPSVNRLLNYDIDTLTGTNFEKLLAIPEREIWRSHLADYLKSAKAGIKDFKLISSDGNKLDFSIMLSNIMKESDIVEIVVIAKSISIENELAIERSRKEFDSYSAYINKETSETSKQFGSGLLKEYYPELFDEFVERYSKIIELVIEQRVYKVDNKTNKLLQNLASDLGFLKSTPRDIIFLHSTVMKPIIKRETAMKANFYLEEGKLVILELMGYLTSFYRNYFI